MKKMNNYIKASIIKFKGDALSKVLYDVLKWGLIFITGLLLSQWFIIKDWMSVEYMLTRFWLILSAVLLIIISMSIITVIYKKRLQVLQKDSMVDELTGLQNHKALKIYLEEKITYCKANKIELSVMLIDVDNFKDFNTEFGYETADLLIKELGKLLSRDKRFTDETFRYHLKGDEFVVVATDTNIGQADQAADRKRELIEKLPVNFNGVVRHFTVSCGVTQATSTSDYDSIMKKASKALMSAKSHSGKNTVRYAI